MTDARITTGARILFVCIMMGLSGCNGCRGCEGQTIEAPAPSTTPDAPIEPVPAATSATAARPTIDAVPTVVPSAAPDPRHDPTGVRRCCNEINATLGNVPDKHKATWKAALAACHEAIEKNNGRKDLDKVRELLTPVGWPAACQ